jgi:Rad3-related DNA helicase
MDSEKRFVAQALPTGSGKSLCYVARALLTDQRVAVLTSTKALQEQLLVDFEPLGMTDIRGRANYPCSMSSGMTCEDGAHAGCKMNGTGGCPYSCAYQIAKQARFVVTNYAYWILQHRYGEGLGSFDLLVLDEAHAAPDEVCDAMSVGLNGREVYRMLGADFLADSAPAESWRTWALALLPRARAQADRVAEGIKLRAGMGDPVGVEIAREAREWKNLVGKLETLATMRGQWEAEATKSGCRIDPLWASQHSDILFLDVPHVLATSATVVPKTLEMLGIANGEADFQEYPSIFPAYRSPVIFIPTVRVTHKWTASMMDLWLRRIDQLLSRRLDRKGVIHTVSYARRDLVLANSVYADSMISHSTDDAVRRVEAFRARHPPAVLVSPSMATGWDFLYEAAEFQIIAKVPYPDTRSKIMAARVGADPRYQDYVTTQQLVQSCGRGMRAADDRCENLVVDDMVRAVMASCQDMLPKWFRRLYRRSNSLPEPPDKLTRKKLSG